jgi:hypothetical protein
MTTATLNLGAEIGAVHRLVHRNVWNSQAVQVIMITEAGSNPGLFCELEPEQSMPLRGKRGNSKLQEYSKRLENIRRVYVARCRAVYQSGPGG